MHMANELLSVSTAAGTTALAGGVLAIICSKAKKIITSDKLPLMGILGAFIFAAQMVNFRLPAMPGTSGHMVGTVLLSIILGPHLAAIVMSSVVIIQCLIFQDGGLLAIGCNLINMAIVPSYSGYYIYKSFTAGSFSNTRTYLGAILACVISLIIGAILVCLQAGISGVIQVPLNTFLITMIGVHFLVGIIEGLVTISVLAYLQQVRPDILINKLEGKIRLSTKSVLISFAVLTLFTAGFLSLAASSMPDGLEWSYLERPDQPDFEPIVENQAAVIKAADEIQSKLTPLPDYSIRTKTEAAKGWTSFAGVIGAFATMLLVWAIAAMLRKKQSPAAFEL